MAHSLFSWWPAVLLALAFTASGETNAAAQVQRFPETIAAAASATPAPASSSGLLVPSRDLWRGVRLDAPAPTRSARPSLARDIAGDFQRFFTTRETYTILAMGLSLSGTVRPLDQPIFRSGFNEENGGPRLEVAFEAGEVLGGGLVQIGGAAAAWGLGAWLDKPGMSEVGRDLVRAQVLAQSFTHVLKRTVRRVRPDESSRASFPSGHSSGSFATATVLYRHYGWKVGAPAYGVAAYIAASRISENKHFLSDLVFGAAIGIAAGRTVTFGAGPARFEVSPLVTAGGGGVSVAVSGRR